jgi:hypothetical protein
MDTLHGARARTIPGVSWWVNAGLFNSLVGSNGFDTRSLPMIFIFFFLSPSPAHLLVFLYLSLFLFTTAVCSCVCFSSSALGVTCVTVIVSVKKEATREVAHVFLDLEKLILAVASWQDAGKGSWLLALQDIPSLRDAAQSASF